MNPIHNPTRRMKRFRPSKGLSETGTIPTRSVAELESPINYVRLHDQAQPDTVLRGAMLVALVVVTIVLYLVLWELERSSFVSVPKPNWSPNAVTATSLPSATMPPLAATTTRWREGLAQKSDRTNGHITTPSVTPFAWLPRVTRVPDELDAIQVLPSAHGAPVKGDVLPSDAAYCHGSCRFLLPVRIGEQESKARLHFMQLRMLARRLNRTIVLPNVGNGRMSTCSEWPFNAYYDTNGLADGSDYGTTIDLDAFGEWTRERPEPPSSFLMSLQSLHRDHRELPSIPGDPEGMPFIVQQAAIEPKVGSCLESKLARLRSSLGETALSVLFDPGRLKADSESTSSRLVHLLSTGLDLDMNADVDLAMEPPSEYTYDAPYTNASYLSLVDIDVLILNYDLRHPLFPLSANAHSNLHYAPALYDLADRLSDHLGSFVGVHWRMETVPVQNLAWCAAALVSTLHRRLLQDDDPESVRYVWLATDYPHRITAAEAFPEGVLRVPAGNGLTSNGIAPPGGAGLDPEDSFVSPRRKSSTFKTSSREHDDAMDILAEAFRPGGDLEAWTLTDLAAQLHRYPYVEGRFELNETLLSDAGVFGILDKLVIVQAAVFVSGSAECSKTSSFSKQIIETRQETFEAERGKGTIRNVVEHFGSQ